MVSARLVDCVDSPDDEMPPLPSMMFAAGDEPVGVRVLTYQSSSVLKRIFNALDEEEVEIIRGSTFGKLIEIADKPVFSGRFARYMLSRQLKTKKKHEVWFRFARQPVRFSLREFAIVTGLPCGKFPRKSKMKLKETISEKPYWPTLFGKVEVVTVTSVIKMLHRKTVKDKEIRIRYACLALLESVLLPTSLNMKISRDHVEAIEDLDAFFSYPWGRLAFDMLMVSIKERDEVALSQNTIAVKGFALALQLVMVEAVPSLTAVVQDTFSSSESDSEDGDGNGWDMFHKKQTLNPAHARSEDKRSDVIVRSVLHADPLRPIDVEALSWSDEEHDEKVDNLLVLINSGHQFESSSFRGGLTKIDVLRMRESVKTNAKGRKGKKIYSKTHDNDPVYIAGLVLEKTRKQFDVMEGNIKGACSRVENMENKVVGQVDAVLRNFKEEMLQSVKEMVSNMWKTHDVCRRSSSSISPTHVNAETAPQNETIPDVAGNDNIIRNVLDNISEYSTPPRSTHISQEDNHTPTTKAHDADVLQSQNPVMESGAQSANSENKTRNNSCRTGLGIHKLVDGPSFSLGVSEDEQMDGDANIAGQEVDVVSPEADDNVEGNVEEGQTSRKSKRQKTVPSRLHENFHCGPHLLSRVRESKKYIFVVYDEEELSRKYSKLTAILNSKIVFNLAGLAVTEKEIRLFVERPRFFPSKVVDILVRLLRTIILPKLPAEGPRSSDFLDTKFAQTISRTYPKFLQSRRKETYLFPKGLRDYFPTEEGIKSYPTRYYFPFNVGNKHWVGISFDAACGVVTVLDCNASLYKDSAMEKMLTPIVQMLPYIAKFACLPLGAAPVIQCYDFARPNSVAQHRNHVDSGLMAVLLMATHAMYGLEACKYISTDMLDDEGKCAAILAYEFKDQL